MRHCSIAAALVIAVAMTVAQPDVIDVPLADAWGAVPGWTPNDGAAQYDYTFQDGFGSFRASGGGRVMIWARHPQPRLDTSKMRFVSLRYRLTNTDNTLGSYLLYLDTGDSGGMYARNLAFGARDLLHDGEWHTATTTLHPFPEIGTMALRFRALEGSEGRLDVAYLRFSAQPPRNSVTEVVDWQPGHVGVSGEAVDLGDLRQTSLAEVQKALDLSDWFTDERLTVSGINFHVPLDGAAALSTTRKDKQGVVIPVGERAAALYLLMGASFPYKMLAYGGWQPGDMTDRPEQFQVTIRYGDGATEEQVPYCVGKERYGIWRGVHAYALPLRADGQVREIELWDGMLTSSFHVVAMTAAGESLVPPVPDTPLRTPPGQPARPMKPSVQLRGDQLTVRNQAGVIRFSLGPGGFSLVAARNARSPDCRLRVRRVPLFSIQEGDAVWADDAFKLLKPPEVSGTRAECSFVSREAQVRLKLTIDARRDETALRLSLENLADQPRSLDLVFPQTQIGIAEPADLWYFYPSMCPAWSNTDHRFETAYSGEFPVQFMDLYDRRNGGGLYVGTRDRSVRQRYYRLAKDGAAATAAIAYTSNPPLAPEETVVYPETVIGLHGGDWRPSLAAYQRWLKSWYRPAHPRPDWYQKVWNFRTYWTHTMGDGKPEWNLFNLQTGEYQTEHFLKQDRELFGQVDMGHFFDWRISKQYGRWGDYSHYEDIGGLEKFRGMVKRLQDDGVRVGLYLDCYLCSQKSLIGQKHGEEWALGRQHGGIGTGYSTDEDPMYNMCVLHPGWQDYLAETCARVARETGCDGIYLDEGMTDYEAYWCWSDKHEHPLPGVNQLGLIELARKARAALPDDVALYAEWVPADAMVPYLDGAYQASLRFSDIRLSPGFLQLARFTFPDFKVFTISNAGSMYDGIWEGMKYSLFNGVPLYTLSWGHDEESLPLIRKMSKILHEHQEAFLTATPHPYVDTERHEVYCNEFPGETETVWTFWNGRYRTVGGPLLKVTHVPGARYTDLWNGGELSPTIENGAAVIATTLGPRGIGAVSQTIR